MTPILVPLSVIGGVAIVIFAASLLVLIYTIAFRLVQARVEQSRAPTLEKARKAMLMAVALGTDELDPIPLPAGERGSRPLMLVAARLLSTLRGGAHEQLVAHLDRSGFTERARLGLRSRSPITRGVSCELLGAMRAQDNASDVMELVTDDDSDVRRSAVRALGRFGDPHAVPGLLDSLHGPKSNSPIAVASALVGIGSEGKIGLAAALGDSHAVTRRVAAQVLGLLNCIPARTDLIEALAVEADPRTRVAMVRALGRIGGGAVREPLHSCLTADDPALRVAAVEAVAEVADPQTLADLPEHLFDPNPRVCRATAMALDSSGPAGRAALERAPSGTSAAAYAREAITLGDLVRDRAATPTSARGRRR